MPALAHLRTQGFAATLAVASHLVVLWSQSGLVERAIDLEALGLHRLFAEPVGDAPLGPLAGYDAVVSWLGAGDPVYRGNLERLGRPLVVARAMPPPDARAHVSRHLLETLAPLGPVPSEMPGARMAVAPAIRADAIDWLGVRGLEPRETVCLQIGAGSPAKIWPGFGALARRLRGMGTSVVVHAGPPDARMVGALVATGALDGVAVARDWPLARVAALLGLVCGTIGNDSGPTHLAAAVGSPTVALFGPTRAERWAPAGRHVRVLAGQSPEAPWDGVTVDRVIAALHEVAGGAGASRMVATASGGRPR
jgi:ADP-heptose:LPS heptosyltransferase